MLFYVRFNSLLNSKRLRESVNGETDSAECLSQGKHKEVCSQLKSLPQRDMKLCFLKSTNSRKDKAYFKQLTPPFPSGPLAGSDIIQWEN